MVHYVKLLAALPQALSSVPSTHVRQLTDACNSSSEDPIALFLTASVTL